MSADVDIDFLDRSAALAILPHIPAMMIHNNVEAKHNTGIYLQEIPQNPMTGLASLEFKKADELGYFKIDFINNSTYEGVRDEEHLVSLLENEPLWELLENEEFVGLLAHIHSHYNIVKTIKPKSVEDLAVVLAIIRPGKRHLLNEPRSVIDSEIWDPPNDDSYHFKKSHSISYALSIVVQMNLIVEQSLNDHEREQLNV